MGHGSGRGFLWFIFVVCAAIAATVLVSKRVIASRNEQAAQSGHAELVRQQQLARSEGIPLTVAEFVPKPPTADSENAAPLYHRAVRLLTTAEMKSGLLQKFDPFHLENSKTLAVNRLYLAQAEPALELVEKAAMLPKCDLKLMFSITEDDFPAFSEFKFLAKVATGKAQLEAYDGHPDAALTTIAKVAPICGHLAQSHTIVAAFVGATIDPIFTHEIAKILAKDGSKPGIAEAASRALTALGPMPDLIGIQEGGNLIRLDALRPPNFPEAGANPAEPHYVSSDPQGLPDDLPQVKTMKHITELARRPGLMDRWEAVEVESTREYVAFLKGAGDDWLQLETQAKKMDADFARPTDDVHAWVQFSGTSPWAQALDIMARELSYRRVLAQSAAALGALSRTGKLPTTLPLTGKAARDPLGKGPLHYRVSGSGFTVYGVGPQGVDHGGKPRDPKSTTNDYDIVFTYPAKP